MINDEGDIVVPVDPRYLGLWLTGLFGDPDTTDNLDGSWDHEFASGGEDLPSYTLEVGMPKVPAFFRHAGVKLNSIALEFTRSGPAAATISAIAQGETRFGTTQGGTPTSLTFSRISQFQGSIKRAGSPVGNLTGGSVTYSNNLEKIETIRDDGLIEGADPTIAALTGRIDVRFADTTLIDLAAGGTPVDLEFAYTLSAQAKLVLTAHEVYCPSPSSRSRARAACRRASTSAAPRTRRRADAHGDAHQRSRWVGLWLTNPCRELLVAGRPWRYLISETCADVAGRSRCFAPGVAGCSSRRTSRWSHVAACCPAFIRLMRGYFLCQPEP